MNPNRLHSKYAYARDGKLDPTVRSTLVLLASDGAVSHQVPLYAVGPITNGKSCSINLLRSVSPYDYAGGSTNLYGRS